VVIDFALWAGPYCRGYAWEWLRARADAGGAVMTSQREMASIWGWSRPAVQRFLKDCCRKGLADPPADPRGATITIRTSTQKPAAPMLLDLPDPPEAKPTRKRAPSVPKEDIAAALGFYAQLADARGLSQIILPISAQREAKLKAILRDHGVDRWHKCLQQAYLSPHLYGVNTDGFRAGFDFFIVRRNFDKTLEGGFIPAAARDAKGAGSVASSVAADVLGRR